MPASSAMELCVYGRFPILIHLLQTHKHTRDAQHPPANGFTPFRWSTGGETRHSASRGSASDDGSQVDVIENNAGFRKGSQSLA